MTAITAVTAQNSVGVQAIAPMAGDMVADQIACAFPDIGVDAVKIWMLHDGISSAMSPAALEGVAAALLLRSGHDRHQRRGASTPKPSPALRGDAVPASGADHSQPARTRPSSGPQPHHQRTAGRGGRRLAHDRGGGAGQAGVTSDARIIDVLYVPQARAVQFDHARIDTPHPRHGPLSSAIATLLGHGQPLEHAVRLGRQFVIRAIEAAPGFGAGNGPLGHQACGRQLSRDSAK